MLEGLALVDACCRIVLVHRPVWWVFENPIGRLGKWLGKPRMIFDPSDYGDPYTKRTCLWGNFTPPLKRQVHITDRKKIHYLSPGPLRAEKRSVTPMGFSQAFFEANP